MSTPANPQTMKAHLLTSFNTPYTLKSDLSIPTLSPTTNSYDLLIKVEAASFCHTDELLRTGSRAVLPQLPFIGCHEFAGTVVSVGPSASADQGFNPGDRVGVPSKGFHSCGQCHECLSCDDPDLDDAKGYSVYCPHSKELGLNVPGGFAEYVVVDSRGVTRIPGGMTCLETAPLMCAGITMYTALRKCRLRKGQRVAIIGAGGGLGHLGLQFAVGMGLDVVAVEASDGPLRVVREVSAGTKTLVVDARSVDAQGVMRMISERWSSDTMGDGTSSSASTTSADQNGVDAVLLLTDSQASFTYGMSLLKRHGTMMVVSIPTTGFHINPADLCRRDIKMMGVQVGSVKMLREMMEFVGEHGVRVVSKVYPFEELNKLVEDSHHSEGGKYVLDVGSAARGR